MSTEKGYSNSKKFGRPDHKTIHNTGGDSFGAPVIIKSLKALKPQAAIESVALSRDGRKIRIGITGHGASKGDRASFTTGALAPFDVEVLDVLDADNFIIYNINDNLPSVGEFVVVARFASGTFGGESVTTFVKDGVNQVVTEDNVTPVNNTPLPSGLYVRREGVNLPVNDSSIPSEVVSVPVKIMAVDGTNINITAGDINIQSTDMGPNFDSFRLGNGSGNYADINANKEILSHDAEAKTELQSANTALLAIQASTGLSATEATLATVAKEVTLDAVKTAVESLALEDFATLTEQQAQTALLNTIDADTSALSSAVNSDGDPAGSTGLMIGGKDSSGDFQQASVNALGELSVTFGAAGFATETTLSALNNKVASDYGASSGAVRTASQIGNATGQADFNAGADSAQTLRVSANLKRNGNELSYNAGAPDANTLRTALATGHGLATEAKQNDNIAELVDIKSKIGDLTDSPATDPSDTVGMLPFLKAILGALQGAIQTTEGTFTGSVISTQKAVGLLPERATVSGSAPSSSRKKLMIKPSKNNSGSIYLGSSLVTIANGLEIIGPDRLEFNLDATDYYLISDEVGQTVEIIEVE